AQSATDAIIAADSSGAIIYWNQAACALFGYAPEEVVGRSLTLIIPERHRAAHAAGLARARGGGPTRVIGRTVELAGLRKDGSDFPAELSLASWDEGGGRFFSGVIRDVSERHATARRLAQSERAAQAAMAEAQRLERVASEANRAKSAFLAHMSHELRT